MYYQGAASFHTDGQWEAALCFTVQGMKKEADGEAGAAHLQQAQIAAGVALKKMTLLFAAVSCLLSLASPDLTLLCHFITLRDSSASPIGGSSNMCMADVGRQEAATSAPRQCVPVLSAQQQPAGRSSAERSCHGRGRHGTPAAGRQRHPFGILSLMLQIYRLCRVSDTADCASICGHREQFNSFNL